MDGSWEGGGLAEVVTTGLHVLIADERQERLAMLADVLGAAGHEVSARLVTVAAVAAAVHDDEPDLAIVAVGEEPAHALDLIGELIDEAVCPVIVWLDEPDAEFSAEAAERGVFASLADSDPHSLQSAIEVALRRYAELQGLRRAFWRRAIVERAKGMLIERHAISERVAFEQLRAAARTRRIPVVAAAEALLQGRLRLDPAASETTAGRDRELPAPPRYASDEPSAPTPGERGPDQQ